MTSIVNGFTQQKSTKTEYVTDQPCDCLSCTAFTDVRACGKTDNKEDWNFGHENCCFTCPTKKRCAKPDPAECYIGLDAHKRNPLSHTTWNGKGPNLQCVFDVDKINTMAQISNFKQKFDTHGDYNQIVANYCQQSSDTCTIDPDTGKSMSKCSRLKSTGKDGELCRSWFNQQPTQTQDTVVQNYCTVANTPDCKCVNRALNDTYKALKPGKIINDGCWFLPCANPQAYLHTTDIESPKCPDNFCDVIFNIIKDRDVTIDDVKNDINCTFKEPNPPPNPTPKPTPPNPTPKPTPPNPTPPNPTPPNPTPPNPTPPNPTPPNPTPPTISKKYLMVLFLVLVLLSSLFKPVRNAFFEHPLFASMIVVLLGGNVFLSV